MEQESTPQSQLRARSGRIFIHRHARCGRPQLPPTGSSWTTSPRHHRP